MEIKRIYIKPVTEEFVILDKPTLLSGTETLEPYPDEPSAKSNNLWDMDENDADGTQYGFHRVGGSHKSLWED